MKNSTSILIITMLIFSLVTFAAKFSGRVVDENGTPLAGVKIFMLETEQSSKSDGTGEWSIKTDNKKLKTLVFHKAGFTYEQLFNHAPQNNIEITLRKAIKSAATLREEEHVKNNCNTIKIPDNPSWNIEFEHTPLKGDLAPDQNLIRRDPSAVIKVNGLYYIYYSFSRTMDTTKIAPWDKNDLYYASSKDGISWEEKGMAVGRGEAGTFDHRSVFTTEILADKGKFYLVYQAAADKEGVFGRNTVGMAWADSPEGPWTKLKNPVLRPTYTNDKFFDNTAVHDPCIVKYKNKYHLYYKGECRCRVKEDCVPWCDPVCGLRKQVKWGVAIADSPVGPYTKSVYNPITNTGHETMVWPYKDGMAILQHQDGPEAQSIQYSEDGFNFEIKGKVGHIPEAAGLYRQDVSQTDPHKGVEWGVAHKLVWNVGPKPWMYIYRFEKVVSE